VDLTSYELRRLSQNGEDGVIGELLRQIGAPVRFFVEFGAEAGVEGNCAALGDDGWPGLLLEADPAKAERLAARWAHRADVVTRCCAITPENVEAEFRRASVPAEPALVSIDVDGADWHIWRVLVAYRPRLLIIEYNGSLPIASRLVQPLESGRAWDGTDYFGASLGAMEQLGRAKGYELVHTEQAGVNAFFVREDLLEGTSLPTGSAVTRRVANYFGSGGGHPRDPHGRPWLHLAPDATAP